MPGVRSAKWVIGAYLVGLSHWLLDAVVHSSMQPFWWIEGNPMYMGWMVPLSWALVPLTAWMILQFISACGDWLRHRRNSQKNEIHDPDE
jgi:membrane-bound metal-dependent hydrolase YbcI (DUF457 family)